MSPSPGVQANHNATYDITPLDAGFAFPTGRLAVHQGDRVHFTVFDSLAVLPLNLGWEDWADVNSGPGAPYVLVVPDPDDRPGTYKFNNNVVFPNYTGCGTGDAPCAVNAASDELVTGFPFGAAPQELTIRIDATPGNFLWVVATSRPRMRMKITVVPDAEPATTQVQISAAAARRTAAITDTASALDAKFRDRDTTHRAGGRIIHDVWVGVEHENGATLFDMYPRRTVIRRGQRVRFHFNELLFEDHTATFPVRAALEVARSSFVPWCDTNGDAAAGGDEPIPPNFECPGGNQNQLEFELHPRFVPTVGDGVFPGGPAYYENSGLRGVSLGTRSWTVRFNKVSSRRGYRFLCLFHPDMRGKVIVRPRRT